MNILLFVGPKYGRALLRSICKYNCRNHNFTVLYNDEQTKKACRYLRERHHCITRELTYGTDIVEPMLQDCVATFDCSILLWWPKIIKGDVISQSRVAPINIHPSPLPIGRGKSHNFWAVFENLPIGATVHFIDEGIDSGQILFRCSRMTRFGLTGREAYTIALYDCLKLARYTIEYLEDIVMGKIMYCYRPMTVQEESMCNIVRYSREFNNMSTIDLNDVNDGIRKFLRLCLAKDFRPHSKLRVVVGDESYNVTVSEEV